VKYTSQGIPAVEQFEATEKVDTPVIDLRLQAVPGEEIRDWAAVGGFVVWDHVG
jgi:hypothetical protein